MSKSSDGEKPGNVEGERSALPTEVKRRVLISRKETSRRLGIHELTTYRWQKTIDDFPKPIKLSPNRTVFIEDEVEKFIETRPRIEVEKAEV